MHASVFLVRLRPNRSESVRTVLELTVITCSYVCFSLLHAQLSSQMHTRHAQDKGEGRNVRQVRAHASSPYPDRRLDACAATHSSFAAPSVVLIQTVWLCLQVNYNPLSESLPNFPFVPNHWRIVWAYVLSFPWVLWLNCAQRSSPCPCAQQSGTEL